MTFKSLLLGAAALAVATPALAGGFTLQSKVLKAETVKVATGGTTERLVPAIKATPGDAMVFVLAYRNEGAQPATDVVLNNPVPATMIYRGAGAGGEPEVSTDGTHFARLSDLTVAKADGSRRPAQLAEVTHVRWHLANPIAPGAAGEVSFHAVLR